MCMFLFHEFFKALEMTNYDDARDEDEDDDDYVCFSWHSTFKSLILS